MKRLIHFIAISPLCAILLFTLSCQRSTLEQSDYILSSEQLLSASSPSSASTRVGLNDEGVEGISVTWSNHPVDGGTDEISIFEYQSGNWISNFRYIGSHDSNIGDFERIVDVNSSELTDGVKYIAVYPAVHPSTTHIDQRNIEEYDPHIQSQNEALGHLSDACMMFAEFTFDDSLQTIDFVHQLSIMTIKFTMAEGQIPTSLTFIDGSTPDREYEVTFTGEVSSPDNNYTSHIMVIPTAQSVAPRSLTFLVNSNGPTQMYQREGVTKAYLAGQRYTADFSKGSEEYSDIEEFYGIYSGEDLANFRDMVNSGDSTIRSTNARLMADIDLSTYPNWEPIGGYLDVPSYPNEANTSTSYLGTFDGNGYTISGLTITGYYGRGYGLFGVVGDRMAPRSEIRDVTLISPSVSGYYSTGIVAYAINSTIRDCKVEGGTITTSDHYAAGIVGEARYSDILSCSNSASISGYIRVGGIIASLNNQSGDISYIDGCTNSGAVTTEDSGFTYIGGVAGIIATLTFSNNHNSGTVSGTGAYVGGVVGRSSDCHIKLCSNTGTLQGDQTNEYMGGLIGYDYNSNIVSSYSDATIAVKGQWVSVGGIAGYSSYSDFYFCYSSGLIELMGYKQYVGGFTGNNKGGGSYTSCFTVAHIDLGSTTNTADINPFVGVAVPMNYISSYYTISMDFGTNSTISGLSRTPNLNSLNGKLSQMNCSYNADLHSSLGIVLFTESSNSTIHPPSLMGESVTPTI